MDWPNALILVAALLLIVAVFYRKRRWAIAGLAVVLFATGILIDWPGFVRGFRDGYNDYRK